MGLYADRLATRLQTQAEWPTPDDDRVWRQVRIWIAFRENDRDVLRSNARWRNTIRDYRIDPLGPKINEAFASTIFGSKPTITAKTPGDQGFEDNLVEGNNLASQLQRQEKRCSGEAEVWYRLTSNPAEDSCPMVVWKSRLNVVPLFHKDVLRAAAFFTELNLTVDSGAAEHWRHFEIIDDQSIRNLLFRGTKDTLGLSVPLGDHPDTQDLIAAVEHELPYMPAGCIPNREGDDVFYAISDFSGIEDFLYGLNETLTIFMENIRLTLKKRVTVPASAVDESGTIDASQEAIVVEDLHQELGARPGSSSQFNVLEYTSNVEEVILAQNALAEAALTRLGIVPSYVGMSGGAKNEGRAMSGTALRLRLIPTVNAAEDRAQYWDDRLPKIMTMLQILDARSVAEPGQEVLGGFGRAWATPGDAPAVERGNSLPEDPVEQTTVHASRVTASIESRETAVRALHKDWSDKQVAEEMARMDDDLEKTRPGGIGSLLSHPSEPEPPTDLPDPHATA